MKISRRLFLVSASSMIFPTVARADLYDDYINSRSKQPFVSFFARNDTASGHAFVSVGTELDNGLTVYEGIYGYYPASGDKKIMKFRSSDRGIITFKENDYPSTIRYRKNVDDTKKRKALAVFDKWNNDDPRYNILAMGGKNCNSLAKEVAEAIGLKIPADNPGLTFPADYITRLRTANQPR
jgi:hypothetical protein